jgi:mono/diheme cytochrome c family protein
VTRALFAAGLASAMGLLAACATAGGPGGAPATAGERLYRSHCGSCHRLRDPAEHTRARWAWAVNEFGNRAHLAPAERPAVLEWLQARASDAPAAR